MNLQSNLLFSYLSEESPADREYYELIRYELDSRIYYYGDHYRYHLEQKPAFPEQVKNFAAGWALSTLVLMRSSGKRAGIPVILSSAYFNLHERIDPARFIISRPPWQYNGYKHNVYSYRLYKQAEKIRKKLLKRPPFELFTDIFFDEVRRFETGLENWVLENDFKALFVPSNVSFFDKLAIKVFRKLGRPSFTFIHGLPGGYSLLDNGLADYLAVWGESIRQNFIQEGIAAQKIIVTGHPAYKIDKEVPLSFNLENVLVISKSLPGTQVGGRYTLRDRSNLVYYLMNVRDVLKKLGVREARLRPHPSENPAWYLQFLGADFFTIDDQPLHASLKASGVVIGPTSTVFVETLQVGVNYTVFEPRLPDGRGLDGGIVVPPFDGSDSRVPSADSQETLSAILTQKKCVNRDVLRDYISQEFNAAQLLDIIECDRSEQS